MATTVSKPTFTDVVNQNYFIESQGGAKQPVSYLDAFPDSVYTKAIDSVLVTFLYALLGPAGAGSLSQEYLLARLQYEDAMLNGASLDQLYTSPFAFARLAEETYDIDAHASLLSSSQRAQILAQDAAFRNRAIDFLKGIRAGGTLLGFQLVAKSGLNHPVDVIENWRALYDQYMDEPLGLDFRGTTTLLSEVIILPRQSKQTSSVQTLTITGNPYSGYFTLSYPAGPDYQTVTFVGNDNNILNVPEGSVSEIGQWIALTGGDNLSTYPDPMTWLTVSSIVSPTQVMVETAGQPVVIPTGPVIGFIENARTYPLSYDATAEEVQAALWNLPVIGKGNVAVSGGPFPSESMTVEFTRDLANVPAQTLQFNLAPDPYTGVVAAGTSPGSGEVVQMTDVNGNSTTIDATVTVDTAGASSISDQVTIAPADQHAMEIAIDTIRPLTTFVTTQPASATRKPQPINTSYAPNEMTQVLLYVTGESSVKWIPKDQVHWIESGIEHEAPRALNTSQQHYAGFHNIANVMAYTEGALNDQFYNDPTGEPSPIWARYYNSMIGLYSDAQLALTPVLSQYQNPNAQHNPQLAKAPSPDPLVITNSVNGTNIINYEYPADYLSLPGVPQLRPNGTFWSSTERSAGTDYLEIDLGSVQAVNYIYFEATSKPYSIDAAYDVLDMSPQRNFKPASFNSDLPSVTSLSYDSAVTNPWSVVTMNLTNALGQQIFTRYIRLGFTKNPGTTPYTNGANVIPYSIEVRNLRIGRVVS